MMVVAVKHPAFEEEREWRLIYLLSASSQYVPHETVTINGVPQLVFKAQFQHFPEADVDGISLPEMLEHVMIGPTQYVEATRKALITKLFEAGVTDAAAKVFATNIPLRT
jgi:hypothetical protein